MDGTTYLPVRAVADALGLEVTWDQERQTVALSTPGGQAPVPEESASPYSRTDPVPLGTAHTFRYAKGDDDWTITMQISESLRGDEAWQALKAANQFNDPAPTGKEYVLVRLSAKVDEASDPDQAVAFHLAGFDLYSADSVQYTAFWTVVTPSPKFDGRVYQGGTLDGYLAFLVNQSDPAPKVVFGADYTGAGGAWFSLT